MPCSPSSIYIIEQTRARQTSGSSSFRAHIHSSFRVSVFAISVYKVEGSWDGSSISITRYGGTWPAIIPYGSVRRLYIHIRRGGP